ncbi:MAG: K(+)-transporting ATPase subunit C [Bacteriovoracia bacterium]
MTHFKTTFRIIAVTWIVCCGLYSGTVWVIGQTLSSDTAQGSIMRDVGGQIVGSRQVAQAFSKPQYFWPRPSAVNYAADSAGGSNLSPTNSKLKERAQETLKGYAEEASKSPVPVDLIAASGSGLDPHITEAAALYQAKRVAKTRNLPIENVESMIRKEAFTSGGMFTSTKLVNVLSLNLALDENK